MKVRESLRGSPRETSGGLEEGADWCTSDPLTQNVGRLGRRVETGIRLEGGYPGNEFSIEESWNTSH